MVLSERDAKRFFIDNVVAQALEEGQPLSDAQRWMLSYSDSDPEFEVDPDKLDAFNRETSDDEYEARIAGLIKRRYRRAMRFDPATRDRYREAYAVLSRGDHYLLPLLDTALDGQLRPRTGVARFGTGVLLLVPAAAAVLMAAGILLRGLPRAGSQGEVLALLAFSLFLGSLAYYLIRLWRKYD